MTVLLVNPPVNRLCEVKTNYFPLGIGYLAALTNKMGYSTRIYNAEFTVNNFPLTDNSRRLKNHELFVRALYDDGHDVWNEFRSLTFEYKPKIIGFSCTSASICCCLKMAQIAKKIAGSITVFGGMHPTILPEETAREKVVDYIVTGEAENSFSNLVAVLLDGGDPFSIPGVGGMRDGVFYHCETAPIETNLSLFPLPDRDCVLFAKAHRPFLNSIITSRGCPFNCTFCSGRSLHKGYVRFRDVEDVIEELLLLKEKYGVKRVNFYDDSLVLNRKRIVNLLEKLIQKKMNLHWTGFTRVDSIDSDLAQLMKKSGCIGLYLGVESGSDRILSRINKGYTREQAIKSVKIIKNSKIPVGINIIVGLPFEREEDISETMSLIKELNVYANINTFTPYPGSVLYKECVERKMIKDGLDWTSISQHSMHNAFVDEISIERYKALLYEIVAMADHVNEAHSFADYFRRTLEIFRENNYDIYRSCCEIAKNAIHVIKTKI